jgi:hypothetical protein
MKLSSRQLVELEFDGEDGALEVCACQVEEVSKRKIVLSQATQQRLENAMPGCKVRVCTVNGEHFSAAGSQVLQIQGQTIEITAPGSDVEELPLPASDAHLQVAMQAEYRAMKMPYTQKADVVEVQGKVIIMTTNMKIPPMTELHVSLSIPAWGKTVASTAKTLGSAPLQGGRKHTTQVEFEGLSDEDEKLLWRCACLQHCRKQTRERK